MKKFLTFVATALVAGSAFAQMGEPNEPRPAFKQVGTVFEGVKSPDEVEKILMKLQPNEGGFGIQDYQHNNYGIGAFGPLGTNVSNTQVFASKYRSSGNFIQLANVDIPHGVQIDGFSVWGTDSDAAANMLFEFRTNDANAVTGSVLMNYTTGADANVPGDFVSFIAAPANTFANTFPAQYTIAAWNTGTGTGTNFKQVVVWYHRRISPAPVASAFGDVTPAHQHFQGISALASSGVTLGCGGGNFCPSQAVTRAEMATFLSRALGLHWPYTVSP